MNAGLTPSEILVNELSSSNFLRLWTHPNPIGKGVKELCDCLVGLRAAPHHHFGQGNRVPRHRLLALA